MHPTWLFENASINSSSPQIISLFTNYLDSWLVWQKPHRPKLKIVGTHTEKAHDIEDLRTSGRDSFANQDFIEELNSVFKSVCFVAVHLAERMYTIYIIIYIYICTFITFVYKYLPLFDYDLLLVFWRNMTPKFGDMFQTPISFQWKCKGVLPFF